MELVMLFYPRSVPITSGSNFPGAYCLAGHKRHCLGYLEARYPAEWYGHSHGMPYPKAIKMEPLNYCYQDEASTVGMNSHQPHVFSTPSVHPFTSHRYPMYHSTVNPFVCTPTGETVYHHQTSIPMPSPNAWSPATAMYPLPREQLPILPVKKTSIKIRVCNYTHASPLQKDNVTVPLAEHLGTLQACACAWNQALSPPLPPQAWEQGLERQRERETDRQRDRQIETGS